MSKIEWTDQTWNPTTGCQKISAGCQNCYAEIMHRRLRGMGNEKYMGLFNVPRCWPKELERKFGKKAKRIFVNSMGDLFHPEIPDYFVYEVFKVIERNPQHIFQILTKRPENVPWLKNWPNNVWFGVSIENFHQLKRLADLREIPAVVKFISIEPLLEDVGIIDLDGIDWVIVGAETGPNARHMDLRWAANIYAIAKRDRVPFFFKKQSKGDSTALYNFCNIKQFPEAK